MEEADDAKIPKTLRRKVQAEMKETGEPWDIAIHGLTAEIEE